MASRFYTRFIQPRSHTEDEQRREYILNILLVIIICLAFLALVRTFVFLLSAPSDYTPSGAFMVFTAYIFFVLLFLLSRRGYFQVASSVLIALLFLFATYTILQWGAFVVQGPLVYALIIIMTGVLLGTRIAVIAGLATAVVLVAISYLQVTGRLQPNLGWLDEPISVVDSTMHGITLLCILAVTWLSNHELERSLHRANRSEKALADERDQLEVKVQQKTAELRRAEMEKVAQVYRFAELGRLSSSLLHELSNSLQIVALNLSGMKKEHDPSPMFVNTVQTMARIDSFIKIAQEKVHEPEVAHRFVPYDIIVDVVTALAPRAQTANVAIVPPASQTKNITVLGRPTYFYQIVSNLVTNGIDAYDASRLDSEPRSVTIELEETQAEVLLSVSDHGLGIPPEMHEAIFEPFYTTKTPGQGIGLSICRTIVENDFSGRMSVVSDIEKGTVFIVRIPT